MKTLTKEEEAITKYCLQQYNQGAIAEKLFPSQKPKKQKKNIVKIDKKSNVETAVWTCVFIALVLSFFIIYNHFKNIVP